MSSGGADNNKRIEMLHDYGIGAIVVKKHLIAQADKEITNLGIYPAAFIDEIKNDARFENIFDNRDVEVFVVRSPNR